MKRRFVGGSWCWRALPPGLSRRWGTLSRSWSGALAFAGGHVVLPLLRSEVVPAGWVANHLLLAGYRAAQTLPALLLKIGLLPFRQALCRLRLVRAGLVGVNAAVVGLPLPALYHPVWTSAIEAPPEPSLRPGHCQEGACAATLDCVLLL